MVLHRILQADAAWPCAVVTAGGLLDAETIRDTDELLWDDDRVIDAARSARDTSTQRPRRSRDAA